MRSCQELQLMLSLTWPSTLYLETLNAQNHFSFAIFTLAPTVIGCTVHIYTNPLLYKDTMSTPDNVRLARE